jgi:uracil-DNA glycosylase
MTEETIKDKVKKIRSSILSTNDFEENRIDGFLDIVLPFGVNRESSAKLILIGQDPTVKNEKTRKRITKTLMLNDKSSNLRKYIEKLFPLDIDKEVYATNLFKYFYSIPPQQTMKVLEAHKDVNIELLKEELNGLPNCPIITLGNPVLRLLSGDNKDTVSNYWNGGQTYFEFEGRKIYPFPHIMTYQRWELYKNNMEAHIKAIFQE